MFKELSGEASQEHPSLVGRPVKFGHLPAMSHGKKPAPIIKNGEMIYIQNLCTLRGPRGGI